MTAVFVAATVALVLLVGWASVRVNYWLWDRRLYRHGLRKGTRA